MNPVRFAVERPYTVAVAVILAVLFSVLALRRIPVQLKPTVDTPVITIRTLYPGAGPIEVEEQISRELEDLLQGADGLRKLSSNSQEGMSTVTLEYEWGVDKDRALVDVITRLSQLPELPPDAEEPVASLTGEMGENMSMWIVARSLFPVNRVRQFVDEEVAPQLERVEGVAELMIMGGAEREIRVLLDAERLAARRIPFSELESALRRGWTDLRGGTIESTHRQFVVRTEGRTTDIDDIGSIVVRRDAEGTVRVADVARVVDGYEETTSIVRSEGKRMVAIGVGRETGANVVDMIEGVEAKLAMLNERFEQRGLDLQLTPVYRDTTYLQKAMGFVRGNLLLGAGLAVAVLLVFLRSLRSVLVVGLAIPISLLTVFLVMDTLGRTVNVISLAGLAFASGMVVDNAIVVLENIFRHLEKGKDSDRAAEDGGREVWGGVLASTLTTVAVFLPILGMKEEAGQLFADLALAIAAAVTVSLLVALSVVPSLAALFFRARRGAGSKARKPRKEGFVATGYGALVAVLCRRGLAPFVTRFLLVFAIVGGSVVSLLLVPPAGYLPSGATNLVLYLGEPLPGTRPEAAEQQMLGLEEWLLEQPQTDRYFLVVAPLFNGGGVILDDAYANTRDLRAFEGVLQGAVSGVPGFRYFFAMQMGLFMDFGKQFTVELRGPDLERLEEISTELQGVLAQWPGVVPGFGVSSDYVPGRPEMRVHADPHRAGELGMSAREVGAAVETAVAGRRVGTFSDGGRDYDLMLVVPQDRVRSQQDLESLPLITAARTRTTLGQVATVEQASGPVYVRRLERERAITLTVNLRPDAALQEVLSAVESDVLVPKLAALPSDYDIALGGSADKFGRTLSALTGGFWLAVLITYLLLVALFRSWFAPIVILVTVPLALSGGVLGIRLASELSPNASFDLLSMLGFVILAGIVVNNAILIVHQANQLRDAGAERRSALRDSARTRLRPILMSVTTSVCGMLPLALGSSAGSELYQGLASVVVGGLVVSTVFTLFLVPALVALGWDVHDLFRRGSSPPRVPGPPPPPAEPMAAAD